VSFNHPRTAALRDPDLPEVATLLSSPAPEPIHAVVEGTGGRVSDAQLLGVTWWPGLSITTRHRISVVGGELEGLSTFVCVAGRIPDGALVVEGETGRLGVWRVPHDPSLPGLVAALNDRRAAQLLRDLGGSSEKVTTRLVAYRPGRRAVVAVAGAEEGLYFKLVRPKKVEALHRAHQTLAASFPVPTSHGYSADLGLIALQAVKGRTLRHVLEDPSLDLPSPASIVDLVRHFPSPPSGQEAPSPIGRLPDTGRLLAAICPELATRVDDLITAIGPETTPAAIPSHGDYYESQLLVEGGEVVGLLDVDTYGWGRPTDDPATMLGHLAIWAPMSGQPERVRDLGSRLIRVWDELVDPIELRRATAATVLSLATGSFRVQTANWPEETEHRLVIAEEWMKSVGEI